MQEVLEKVFPLQRPLIHCITNGITKELVANALLYVGAKPIMAEDEREIESVIQVSSAVLLNIGHLTEQKEACIIKAAKLANRAQKPLVVDAVGIVGLSNRLALVQHLLDIGVTVVKGNISEMRRLAGLNSSAKGVDSAKEEQSLMELQELAQELRKLTKIYPQTVILATGEQDLVVTDLNCFCLKNGVDSLELFTGTGDVVGALIAGVLGSGIEPLEATIGAITYFNVCGEKASKVLHHGMESFRIETCSQLSKLYQENWQNMLKMEDWTNEVVR